MDQYRVSGVGKRKIDPAVWGLGSDALCLARWLAYSRCLVNIYDIMKTSNQSLGAPIEKLTNPALEGLLALMNVCGISKRCKPTKQRWA